MRRSYTMSFITSGRLTGVFLAFALLIGAIGLQSGSTSPYNKHQKAFYAAQSVIDFARPGLVITINSAKIASDGTITVTYTLTDPAGLPLDAAGVTTPGTIRAGRGVDESTGRRYWRRRNSYRAGAISVRFPH
jgi:hypothetical protein